MLPLKKTEIAMLVVYLAMCSIAPGLTVLHHIVKYGVLLLYYGVLQ